MPGTQHASLRWTHISTPIWALPYIITTNECSRSPESVFTMPGIDVHDGLESVFRMGRNTHKQPESVYMLVNHMEEYDAIADAYRDSKRLPFREYIERYTLFEMLGDVRGKKVLDMACGDGFYTRLLKQAGASGVTGVDVSAEVIRLAEQEELRHPLGCAYLHQDVTAVEPSGSVDLVVAMYLLNYARTGEQLRRFCQVCHDALRPGGRFVGFNDNVRNPSSGTVSWKKYGLEKSCASLLKEGDVILYTVTNADGRQFKFKNFFLTPNTYRNAFQKAGFQDFQWVNLSLHPTQQSNPFWNDFMTSPPVIAFAAVR